MNQNDVDQLVGALKSRFAGEVVAEAVNAQGRFRFSVTSQQFAGMTQMERQDAVWAEVDRVLPPATTLDISLILTYAPTVAVASV